jgi:hypothetical protein
MEQIESQRGAEKPTPIKPNWKRWAQRHFFAGLFFPAVVVLVLIFLGGFKHLDILLHEARTTATVFDAHGTSPGRGACYYHYEVDGRTYSGGGHPEVKSGDPPIEVGTTYEIRYSTAHPSFSTAHHPGTIFGQLLVMGLILLGVDYLKNRNARA